MTDKEKLISVLMENPAYDSSWIDKASDMIINLGFEEEELAQYSADKLKIIEQAYKLYNENNPGDGDIIFLDMIKNPDLNATQMQIILTAKTQGVDTYDLKSICDPNLSYGKINLRRTEHN